MNKKNALVFGTKHTFIQNRKHIFDNFNVVGFVDNNKQDDRIYGKPVFSVTDISNVEFDVILVCTYQYYAQITEQLIMLGVSANKIILRYSGVEVYGFDESMYLAFKNHGIACVFKQGQCYTNKSFCIKDGYQPNLFPQHYDAFYRQTSSSVTHQPDVYNLAYWIANEYSCEWIIDIGSGDGLKHKPFESNKKIIAIDIPQNEKTISANVDLHEFIQCDLNNGLPPIENYWGNAVVIVSDVVEHIVNPTKLLHDLAAISNQCKGMLISTPERDILHGFDHLGPPSNNKHVREWNLVEFEQLLTENNFSKLLIDLTVSDDLSREYKTILSMSGTIALESNTTLSGLLKSVGMF
jgi:SAM-dependent methyltransferase